MNANNTVSAEYFIPRFRVDGLRERIDALNKRARRMRVPEIDLQSEAAYRLLEVTMLGAQGTMVTFWHDERKPMPALFNAPGATAKPTGRVMPIDRVTITGAAPRYEGWRFVGTLAHVAVEAGEVLEVIRAVPGETVPPAFRGRGPVCDHCQLSRRRTDTFIVAHENGAYRQVGRNCLADFLGHRDPHDLAAMAELLATAADAAEAAVDDDYGDYERTGTGARYWSLRSFLTLVAACIRLNGWLSKTKAYEYGGEPTATTAVSILLTSTRRAEFEDAGGTTEADLAEAEAAIDWALGLAETADREQCELSDYLYSVNVTARAGVVEYRTAGLAASIVAVYQRERDKAAEVKAAQKVGAASNYVGTVGQRVDLELKLLWRRPIDSSYGDGLCFLHRFVDPDGNVATWFDSTGKWVEGAGYWHEGVFIDACWRDGETRIVRATVKRHEEYKGVKQTVLTRLAEPPKPKPRKPRKPRTKAGC